MLSLRRISAVIIGLVFAFSAVFKLMDPVGTGLIVEGYFQFFHLGFLSGTSAVVGEILSLFEAFLSVALITGVWQRMVALATMSLLAFFTLISILLVAFNPDMSCGCFGKVVELTHLQTLVKNIVLLALSAFAFFPIGKLGKNKTDRFVSFGIAMTAVIGFSIYSFVSIPVLDYTEFAPSYSIVTQQREGYEGKEYPILPVWDESGEYCSELLVESRVVAVSVYKPEKLDRDDRMKIAVFVQDALNAGWTPVVLSAGMLDIPGVDVYMADYKKLLTLNRSNAGLVFMDDGYIMTKRARNNYPSFEEMESMLQKDAVEIYADYSTRKSLILQGFFVAILAVMFFV